MKNRHNKKKSPSVLVLLVLLILGAATSFKAAQGDLDTTFSGDGKLTDFVVGTTFNYLAATVIQPDGKIVTVGAVREPRYLYAARYNSDGSPDTTFGSGTGRTRFQFGGFYNYVEDVVLQPDGKIVIAGCYCQEDFGDYNLALARLNSDGSLDASFGVNGVVTRPDIVGPANSVAIQTDGKIVVAGRAGFYLDWLVLRFNSNGSQDPTFITGVNVLSPGHGDPNSVAIQADGKIVAGGGSYIVRYNANGSLDSTFDGDGVLATPIGLPVAIQTDGKIVAVGGSGRNFKVVRYNPNGSLDTTFDGIVPALIDVYVENSSIAIRSDGKLVVSSTSDNGLNDDFSLLRFNPNGSVDTTFGGGDGETTADFSNSSDHAYGVALDNVGRAVVIGRSDGRFAIARFLLGSGRANADFDGDGRSDVSVFRPSDSLWYLSRSTAGFSATQFGLSSDQITPGDFDGDSKTDIAVWRPLTGTWYIQQSTAGFTAAQWGLSTDLPVPGDYDGDGKTDIAVWRPSTGVWFVVNSGNGQVVATQFGLDSDKPVAGDFDGDGKTDLAVYRPSSGLWFLNQSTLGQTTVKFGISTDKVIPADYDGDGKTDIAVYRDGTWYLQQSSSGFTVINFGLVSDIPVPADYDGDGKADVSVWRPSTGIWYSQQSTSGFAARQFGAAGDMPVPAAYVPVP